MDLSDLLKAEAVLPSLQAQSKKQVLQELCGAAARQTGLSEHEVYETIAQRERLGSTGVGQGVAIPHGKLGALDALVGVFARLDQPVNFDSLDDQPVDLVFALLAPEGAGADHLKALARIARVLRDPNVAQRLRVATDAGELHAVLTTPSEASHAA